MAVVNRGGALCTRWKEEAAVICLWNCRRRRKSSSDKHTGSESVQLMYCGNTHAHTQIVLLQLHDNYSSPKLRAGLTCPPFVSVSVSEDR